MPASPVLPSGSDVEPFPALDPAVPQDGSSPRPEDTSSIHNRRGASSSLSGRLRSVSETFERSSLPEGFMAATGGIASSMLSNPTYARPRGSSAGSSSTQQPSTYELSTRRPTFPAVAEETFPAEKHDGSQQPGVRNEEHRQSVGTSPFANGYHFPPKHTFAQSTGIALRAFWIYFLTPVGFIVTIYGLNIVAWGGMIFLLLCNAAPAMCHPSCNHIDSPRRKWIEWDSQILNALFCVTGFGLAPWRFRDLYFLLQYRLGGNTVALRRLAGIHRGWFRLKGSTELPQDLGPSTVANYPHLVSADAVPFPESKISDTPLTGKRAAPTKMWKMDAVVWLMVWNTILQTVLAGLMWGMNRYDRPGWSTGLFVALACIVAGVGGYFMFLEGKKVKRVEGVPLREEDRRQLEEDRERGVLHYNNIQDKSTKPDAKKQAKKGKKEEVSRQE